MKTQPHAAIYLSQGGCGIPRLLTKIAIFSGYTTECKEKQFKLYCMASRPVIPNTVTVKFMQALQPANVLKIQL